MAAAAKRFGSAIAELPPLSFNQFASALGDASRIVADRTDITAIKRTVSDMTDDQVVDIVKNLPGDVKVDILRSLTGDVQVDLARRLQGIGELGDSLVTQVDGLKRLLSRTDEAADAAASATKTADEVVPNVAELVGMKRPESGWPPSSISKWVDEFESMNPQEKAIFTAQFRGSTNSTTLPESFEKLPNALKLKMLGSDPVLRWRAGQTTGYVNYVRGACKSLPVGCAIGSIGGIVGMGFATNELVDKIKDLYDKSDEERACIATCLPNDWYSSEASGSGTLGYDELEFKDLEELKETSGNDDLTAANTPLCTAQMTPEGCVNMCESRCADLNSTFLQDLTNALTDPVIDLAERGAEGAGKAAGKGLGALLDGIFGEGMGIPAAIGIFIFIIIIVVAM